MKDHACKFNTAAFFATVVFGEPVMMAEADFAYDGGPEDVRRKPDSSSTATKVRQHFPETWLWLDTVAR